MNIFLHKIILYFLNEIMYNIFTGKIYSYWNVKFSTIFVKSPVQIYPSWNTKKTSTVDACLFVMDTVFPVCSKRAIEQTVEKYSNF